MHFLHFLYIGVTVFILWWVLLYKIVPLNYKMVYLEQKKKGDAL